MSETTESDFDALWTEAWDVYGYAIADTQGEDEANAAFQQFIDKLKKIKQTSKYKSNKEHWDSQCADQEEYAQTRITEFEEKNLSTPGMISQLKSALEGRHAKGTDEENCDQFPDDFDLQEVDDDCDASSSEDLPPPPPVSVSPEVETSDPPKKRSSKGYLLSARNRRRTTDKHSASPAAKNKTKKDKTIAHENSSHSSDDSETQEFNDANDASSSEDLPPPPPTPPPPASARPKDAKPDPLKKRSFSKLKRDPLPARHQQRKAEKDSSQKVKASPTRPISVSKNKTKKDKPIAPGNSSHSSDDSETQDPEFDEASNASPPPPSVGTIASRLDLRKRRSSSKLKEDPLPSKHQQQTTDQDSAKNVKVLSSPKRSSANSNTRKDKESAHDQKRKRNKPVDDKPTVDTIVVQVSDDITDDDLKSYFHSSKGGKGEVTNIHRDEDDDNTAYVTFGSSADAERIALKSHKLKRRTLHVTLCTTEGEETNNSDSDSVEDNGSDVDEDIIDATANDDDGEDEDDDEWFVLEVRGIPENKTEEDLKSYFENRRRSGVKDVEQVEIDNESGTALIYFVEGDAVATVLKRAPFVFDKKKLEVAKYLPPQKSKSKSWLASIKKRTVVKVHNTGTIPEETLEMHFESMKRSGGKVKKIKTIEGEDGVYLLYENEKEASAVASRQHTLHKQRLSTTLYQPPKPSAKYKDRFFISGLREATSKEDLKTFLEEKAGYKPIDIVYGDDPGTALVTVYKSSTPICLKRLRQVGKKRPLEGAFLEFVDVPVSNCILVRNNEATLDTLGMYFESKRSGNDEEVEVEDTKEAYNEGEALVFFKHHAVVDNILKKKHKLEGKVLNVSLFVECLGAGGGQSEPSWFKIPPPFTLERVNKYKVKFLQDNTQTENALADELNSVKTTFAWTSDTSVAFTCTVTADTKYATLLVKTWKKDTQEKFNKFLSNLDSKTLNILKETWQDVKAQISSLPKENDAIIYDFVDTGIICVVGLSERAEILMRRVENIVKDVEDDQERKKKEITETLTKIKPLSLKYLVALDFPQNIKTKFPTLEVDIDLTSNEIKFTGQLTDVKIAQAEMYETINTDSKLVVTNMSHQQLWFLNKSSVQTYVESKLETMDFVGVWIEEDGVVTFLSRTDQEAHDVVQVVKQSIKEQVIPLDEDMLQLTTSRTWQEMIEQVHKDNEDLVNISLGKSKQLIVIGTDDTFDVVLEDLNNFMNEKAVYAKEINLQKGIQRFLASHCGTELKKIVHTYREYAANIKCTEHSLTIKATHDGLRMLTREVEKLVKKIQQDEKAFDHPGIAKLFTSDTGDQVINVVEKLERCIIERNVETDHHFDNSTEQELDEENSAEDTLEYYGPKKVATCDIKSKCVLSFWNGDITDLTADAIVNAANEKLEHIGGLAKAIVDKGGLCIQAESSQFVKNNGPVMVGNIAVTGPGQLPCKKIIHAVGPRWNGGRDDEEELLQEAVFNSLEETDRLRFNSIAIPALSTGIYQYPVLDATRVIIGTINDHFREAQSISITEIHICDTNDTTIQDFIEAAKKTFGRAHVKMESAKPVVGRQQQQSLTASSTRIQINVEEGEINKQKTDVIVNTTNSGLDLMNGAVSKSLVTVAGGKTLQQECNKNYPNGIQPGDFAVTTGGRLNCKTVFHTCLPSHSSDQDNKILCSLVKECLTEASQKGNKSICFPALGTGNLGYPPSEVANAMFVTIQEFAATHRKTSLKEVTLVLNSKDTTVVKAFRDESSAQEAKRVPVPVEDRRSRRSIKPTVADDSWKRVDHGGISQVFSVGNIMLTIKSGDLTKEIVECIVNSSNANLDLSQGAVSQAIMKAGGQYLMNEIDTKRGEMKINGITTTSAKGLKAAYIVHVSADNFKGDWRKVVLACLAEAGKQGIKEIAFPALGTGMGATTPKMMGSILVDALEDYQSSPPQSGPVDDVRVVIFQTNMLAPFIQGVQETGGASKSIGHKIMKTLHDVKDYFTGGTSKPDIKSVKPIQKLPSFVKLYFFSDDMAHINRAIERIESRWKDMLINDIVTDPGLKNLDDTRREQIDKLEDLFGVKVEYSKRLGRVRLQGLSSDVIAAGKAIHKIILGEYRAAQEKQKAEMLSSIVEWNYIEVDSSEDSKFIPYDQIINQQIEEAYKSQKQHVEFKDDKDTIYVIDFQTMKEYPEDNDTDKVQVIRRDLMKGSFADEDLPRNWTKMSSESEMILVAQGTPEYTEVEAGFLKSVGGNHKVVEIERVQTKFLRQQFMAKHRQMEVQNPGIKNEQTLWHGTATDAIPSIYKNGFNRSYCGKNATALGEGVYFAVNASYSASNTYSRPDSQGKKYMFRAQVLTGMHIRGQSGMRVPPTRDPSKHILYDSVVDNQNQPSIYVIFNDTQAYPEYLITFI